MGQSIIESFGAVIGSVVNWLIDAFDQVTTIFYNTNDGLTFVGTLAIVGVCMGIVLLVFNYIRDFLHLR